MSHSSRPSLGFLLFLVACNLGVPGVSVEGGPGGRDTADTGRAADLVVTDLSWRLHEEIESLVYVSWEQSAAATVRVDYSYEGADPLSTPSIAGGAGKNEQLLLGIPYDETAGWEVVVEEDGSAWPGEDISTGDLPDGIPVPELMRYDSEAWEPTGRWLVGSINADTGGWNDGQYWMFIVNRLGRIVWAWPGDDHHFTIYVHATESGDLLWDVSTYWSAWDGGAASRVHRMKIDGTITETVATPGMHHAFVELPDGSLVWGAATSNSEELQHRSLDGTVSTLWSCVPFYDVIGLHDWCHTNSIFHSEDTDSYLLSFPTSSTFVLEIDATTGEELRWFGNVAGAWAFEPPTSAFHYQHGVTYTDSGSLLVSSQVNAANHDAVVREYTLDEENETLVEIWNQGLGDGIDVDYAGEAHRLPGGNTLHNTGTTPRVREITPEGEVVWDLAWEGYRLLGRTTFVEDLYLYVP